MTTPPRKKSLIRRATARTTRVCRKPVPRTVAIPETEAVFYAALEPAPEAVLIVTRDAHGGLHVYAATESAEETAHLAFFAWFKAVCCSHLLPRRH